MPINLTWTWLYVLQIYKTHKALQGAFQNLCRRLPSRFSQTNINALYRGRGSKGVVNEALLGGWWRVFSWLVISPFFRLIIGWLFLVSRNFHSSCSEAWFCKIIFLETRFFMNHEFLSALNFLNFIFRELWNDHPMKHDLDPPLPPSTTLS